MEVKKIEYIHGMIESPDNLEGIDVRRSILLDRSSIPENLIDTMLEERIIELDGTYGNPDWGDPIEIDLLNIETKSGIVSIRVFNRGIILLMTNDETMKRLHRFFGVLNRYGETR
jgi:hypothetical protein